MKINKSKLTRGMCAASFSLLSVAHAGYWQTGTIQPATGGANPFSGWASSYVIVPPDYIAEMEVSLSSNSGLATFEFNFSNHEGNGSDGGSNLSYWSDS